MISVMINTYNRGSVLIQNLLSLRCIWGRVRIVVIDDCSLDDTEKLVKDFVSKNKINLKYVRNSRNQGYAKSLNIGMRESLGEFIFILNDDNVMLNMEGFLDIMERYEGKGYIIGTRVIPEFRKSLPKRIADFIYRAPAQVFAGELYNYTGDKRRMVKYCNNAFGFRKDLGIRFDEKSYIKNFFRIESDFQARARKKGARILYFPEIRILDKWVDYGGVREKKDNTLLHCIFNHITFLRKHSGAAKYYKIPCYFVLKVATHPYLTLSIAKTFNSSFKHSISMD